MERLTSADEGRAERQLGVVDGQGNARAGRARSATTGPGTAPGRLRGAGQHPRRRGDGGRARDDVRGERPAAACAAADRVSRGGAGGGRRPSRPAVRSLLVVQRDGGYAALSDVLVDLRVDDHEQPIPELRRIYELHFRLFGLSPREDWLPLEGELRTEVDERLARLGYDSLDAWAPGSRTSRSGWTATTRSIPSSSTPSGRRPREQRLRDPLARRGRGRAAPGAPYPSRHPLGFRPAGINAWKADTRRPADPAARGGQRQRGAVRGRARTRAVHRRRGGGRGAGRHARLRAARRPSAPPWQRRTARSSSSSAARPARHSTPAAGTRSPSPTRTGRPVVSTTQRRSWDS